MHNICHPTDSAKPNLQRDPQLNEEYSKALKDLAAATMFGDSFSALRISDDRVIKIASRKGRRALADEINFLTISLPMSARPFFPKVLDYSIKTESVYMTMPFYPYPSLRALAHRGMIDLNDMEDLLSCIVENLYINLYTCRENQSTVNGFLMRLIGKVAQRLRIVSQHSPWANRLINSEEVVINDEQYTNIQRAISTLTSVKPWVSGH